MGALTGWEFPPFDPTPAASQAASEQRAPSSKRLASGEPLITILGTLKEQLSLISGKSPTEATNEWEQEPENLPPLQATGAPPRVVEADPILPREVRSPVSSSPALLPAALRASPP